MLQKCFPCASVVYRSRSGISGSSGMDIFFSSRHCQTVFQGICSFVALQTWLTELMSSVCSPAPAVLDFLILPVLESV